MTASYDLFLWNWYFYFLIRYILSGDLRISSNRIYVLGVVLTHSTISAPKKPQNIHPYNALLTHSQIINCQKNETSVTSSISTREECKRDNRARTSHYLISFLGSLFVRFSCEKRFPSTRPGRRRVRPNGMWHVLCGWKCIHDIIFFVEIHFQFKRSMWIRVIMRGTVAN